MLSLYTGALVLLKVVAGAWEGGSAADPLPIVIFVLAYAAGLVIGWWRLRPRGEQPAVYALVMGVFLLQGVLYAALWSDIAGHLVPGVRLRGALPSFVQVAALFAFFLVGPIAAVLAPLSTRRGLVMIATQYGGPFLVFVMTMALRAS